MHKHTESLFNVHAQPRLEEIEWVSPYALFLVLKLSFIECNQDRLGTNVGIVASNPVPGGKSCCANLLFNCIGAEVKGIMRRTANDGREK
jgi:hypothetical protein